jgi:hypothetical protein
MIFNLKKINRKRNMEQSMNTKFNSFVNEMIVNYTQAICTKFSLNFEDVYSIWSDKVEAKPSPPQKKITTKKKQSEISFVKKEEKVDDKKEEIVEEKEKDDKNYEKMTRTELIGLCKQNGLKISGTKDELIQRLTSMMTQRKLSPITKKEPTANIIKKLSQNTSTIEVKRNKFGNYEHAESGIVFDKEDKVACGLQNLDGSVRELDDEAIEQCKKYKFQYKLPENLDKSKTSLKDVKLGGDNLNEEDLYDEEPEPEEVGEEDEEEIFDDDE